MHTDYAALLDIAYYVVKYHSVIEFIFSLTHPPSPHIQRAVDLDSTTEGEVDVCSLSQIRSLADCVSRLPRLPNAPKPRCARFSPHLP